MLEGAGGLLARVAVVLDTALLQPYRWLFSPSELNAWAQFPQVRDQSTVWRPKFDTLVRILELDESAPNRQHLIRFRDYWNDAAGGSQPSHRDSTSGSGRGRRPQKKYRGGAPPEAPEFEGVRWQ